MVGELLLHIISRELLVLSYHIQFFVRFPSVFIYLYRSLIPISGRLDMRLPSGEYQQ
jgi:hypothetical protein